jgi:hypothetical protein
MGNTNYRSARAFAIKPSRPAMYLTPQELRAMAKAVDPNVLVGK